MRRHGSLVFGFQCLPLVPSKNGEADVAHHPGGYFFGYFPGATQTLTKAAQQRRQAVKSGRRLVKGDTAQGAARGGRGFRQALMQGQSPVEGQAQSGHVADSALFPLIPNGIESGRMKGQFVSQLQLLTGGHSFQRSRSRRKFSRL